MSQRLRLSFFFKKMKANPLKLFDRGSWSEISSPFIQKIAAAFQTAHLLPEPPFFDFFFSLLLPISAFDKRRKEEAEEEAEAGE